MKLYGRKNMKKAKTVDYRILFLRCLLGVLIVAWCTLIFCMSNETAIESSERSTGLVRRFVGAFVSIFGGDENDVFLMDTLEYYVRKAAHMFLYFILFILVYSFLSLFCIRRNLGFAWSLLYCLVYSMTDEIHQLFIPGRSGSFTDVFIDMIGAVIALLLILVISIANKKIRKRTKIHRSA